jgi:hypothetical protein
MDKRSYLRSQGFTVGDRGRFSAAMQTALAAAPAGAITEPVTVPSQPKPKAVKAPKATVIKVKSKADPKAVRAWAKSNGVTVGDRGRIKPEVFAAYEAAQGEADAPVVERAPESANLTGNHAPMLHSSDAQWGFTDPKGKVWKVGVRTACANTGVSLGWCPETEHRALVGDSSMDLVPVRKV